jgi:nucleotide-binding universal stress UspA family protein
MDSTPHTAAYVEPGREPKNVLVATDFGEPAAAAFTQGREMAHAFGARLHLLHVAEDLDALASIGPATAVDLGRRQMELEVGARDRLRSMLDDDLRSKATETVVMTSNHAAAAILRYADDAKVDLIVLGTHGRHGLSEFFMGSVAQEVVRRARCPVLTLRAPSHTAVDTMPRISTVTPWHGPS